MSLENINFNTEVICNIKVIQLKAINHVSTSFIENNLDKMSLLFINVIKQTAIVTILDRNNLLKYRNNIVKDKRTPTWQIHLEEKVNNIRRKKSFITLITNSQNGSAGLTKHQWTIKAKSKRWYGHTKRHTLLSKLLQLKHKLKVISELL